MDKEIATTLLGGSEEKAARWLGISSALYRDQWPDRLHDVFNDRVWAAIIRREAARAYGWSQNRVLTDWQCEAVIERMLKSGALSAIMADMKRSHFADDTRGSGPDDDDKAERKRPGRSQRSSPAPGTAMTG